MSFKSLNSNTIDYDNTNECQQYLGELFHKFINGLRIVVKSNDKISKNINETYEKTLIGFLRYIPNKYMKDIFVSVENIFILLQCIDINKLIEFKYKIKIPFINLENFDNDKLNIIKSKIIELINKKYTESSDREFLKSLLKKLDPVFDAIEYICKNLPICIQNSENFKVIDDIF